MVLPNPISSRDSTQLFACAIAQTSDVEPLVQRKSPITRGSVEMQCSFEKEYIFHLILERTIKHVNSNTNISSAL